VNPLNIIESIYLLAGITLGIAGIAFAVLSFYENRPRAFVITLIIAAAGGVIWIGYYGLFNYNSTLLLIAVIFIIILAIFFFIPLGGISIINCGESGERVDERDIMFAREEYSQGSNKYEIYYTMRPENKEIDDKIRKLPPILEPGGRYYDPIVSPYINGIFKSIENLLTHIDGEVAIDQKKFDPDKMTSAIKKAVLEMGADGVGIAPLKQDYVYSHVGRGPEKWGSEITNNHTYAIIFTLEMNYDRVEAAPRLPITEESALRYLDGALISVELARYIRNLGYPARAHIAGSNYQLILPPVAYDAGLGELGRLGYLISPRFGPRIRLGAVTTNLPLIADKPINFGVQDFCDKCRKCAVNCPSGAIPKGDKSIVRGTEKWQLNIEKCITYWRICGSDCGLCMKVCPYSHPPTFYHNIVRKGVSRSAFARTVSIWADDIFYGKKAEF
jgi:reductive dehalogenase